MQRYENFLSKLFYGSTDYNNIGRIDLFPNAFVNEEDVSMKWAKNIESVFSSGRVGKCPHCGSGDTDYSITTVSNDMGYGDMWCNTCKRAYHISRMQTKGISCQSKKLPSNLKY